jgi:hypothetical protein
MRKSALFNNGTKKGGGIPIPTFDEPLIITILKLNILYSLTKRKKGYGKIPSICRILKNYPELSL